MIVDFHTHVLPDSFRDDRERIVRADATFAELFADPHAKTASYDELLASMDVAGIDSSLALGYGWTDQGVARESNDYLLEAARKSNGRIIAFCSVNPAWRMRAVTEVERCAEAGAVGVGELHPDTQGFDIADSAVMKPLMTAAESLGLIVLYHASEPLGHAYPGKGTATPGKLLALATAFPDVRIVFAHWGGGLPFYALMPEVLERLQNVWFDSAATPYLYRQDVFPTVSRLAGPDRVLFGSDFPLLKQGRVLKEARAAGLSHEEETAILGGNAARLLGLDSAESD